MAKFPVEMNDDEGQTDAINYLLSGPAGLGQNFAGFSSYTPAYLTGNYRTPFTSPNLTELYVAPITCSSAEQVDSRTFKFTFSSTQATVPFSLGQPIDAFDFTDDFYNDNWGPIGVVICTTTYVIVRTNSSYTGIPTATGGSVTLDLLGATNSTDCNARVTVTGGTDRVFISGQLDQLVTYETISDSPELTVTVQINRYVGSVNDDPVNPDYIFNEPVTVAEKSYTFTGLDTDGTLPLIETVFTTVLDQPPPGFYWYILECVYSTESTGDIQVMSSEFKLRSLSSQVVKQ